ncbi:MAG TPA: hypothetical protein VNI83_11345, partial [Vicinamibacterales bacterium]|nr:hypothetical protein [Vicinamibacterales bacterium]
MSITTSDHAAVLIAVALERAASASAAHRRLHFGTYLGVEPAAVFAALMEDAEERATVETLGEAGELAAIDVGGAMLIPYLVTSAEEAGLNRGSQGFAATLRSHFVAGAGDETRVLLILDANPVETVSTASEDAAALPELAWRQLCRAAVAPADGAPVSSLLEAIASHFMDAAPDGEALTRLAAFAGEPWANEGEAGGELHRLGLYLRDPFVGRDLNARLKEGRKWRSNLERWSEPGVDLAAQLRKTLGGDVRAVRTVLGAVGPFGIDFGAVELEDLKATEAAVPAYARPLVVRGPEAVVKAGDEQRARRGARPRLIAWFRARGQLAIRLAGDLGGGEKAEVRWADGDAAPLGVDQTAMEAVVDITHEGWRFGTLVLELDGSLLDSIELAVYVMAGSWFPIEQALNVDIEQSAFIVEDEPAALAIARGGGVLGPLALDDIDADAGERVLAIARTADGEAHVLPLLLLGEGTEGAGPPPATEEGEEDGEALPPASMRLVVSPVHALLDYGRRNTGELGDLTFRAEEGSAYITVSGDLYQLERQSLGRLNGLAVEAEILRRPENWAFSAVGEDEAVEVLPDSTLERLALGNIPTAQIDAFIAARAAFFAACQAYGGSVYAVAAGVAVAEARTYVGAAAELLMAVPDSGRYQAEFDRLLLLDAVSVPDSGELYLAPTNPVTVAFYLTFAAAARRWIATPGGLLQTDEAAISPAYLVPLVLHAGAWHEVATPSPFLWRRFQPVGRSGAAGEDDGRAISARLKFFLDVYPAYHDPAQTLAITVYEPGDGAAVVDGLRSFYRAELRADDYTLPRLDVTLVANGGGLPPAVHDLLAGGEGSSAADRLIRSRVKVAARAAALPRPPDDFSHLTFVFRTPAAREPAEVGMRDRATSLYAAALAPAPGRVFSPGANVQSFSWGTFGAAAAGELVTDQAGELLPQLVRRTLELVGGQPNALLEPYRTRMPTTQVERGFMPDVYEHSVWVVHLDHLLGVEAFAPDPNGAARYLIDYEERPNSSHAGLSAVTATQRVDAYLDALSGALRELGPLTAQALGRILRLLNSVSGRWALQMLRQSREQILERIGTVAAIAAVQELDHGFEGGDGVGLLIPLDEVARVLPRETSTPRPELSDDLLYIWLPLEPSDEPLPVRGRVLEVKYRSGRGPSLGHARQAMENTHNWLTSTFNDEGPSRLFRARDLAELLRTSASRGVTFGLMQRLGEPANAAFERNLERIASGDYVLDLRFWVEGEELFGDVISIELESATGASRSPLPGAGRAAGVVRLGREMLAALATGQPLPLPEDGWARPVFVPPTPPEPGDDATEPEQPQPPMPSPDATPPGEEQAVHEEAPREARAVPPEEIDEVRQLARALDAAALKYRL